LFDGNGHGVDVFRKIQTSTSFRTEQAVERITSDDASKLIDALHTAGGATLAKTKRQPPEGMARLDRYARQLAVQLNQWGNSGRQFWYREDLLIRYKPQGKGTYLIESFKAGEPEAIVVGQQGRIENLLSGAGRV
jgi:hypothetical protein